MTLIAHIDLSAFEHNVARIVADVSPAKTWIAIKSNAYGHGMLELADNAVRAGASGLAVLDVPAALRLREHGIQSTLFAWLHGSETDFEAAVAADIDLGVSSLAQLEAIAATTGIGRVHLKIDTGLHRNGFASRDWDTACERAKQLQDQGSITVIGVWSHLADAGSESDAAALAAFDDAVGRARAVGLAPEMVHIAASSAALRNPAARHDVVRVGIAAYGISPFDDADGAELGLRPVLRLSSVTPPSSGAVSALDAGWFDGVPQSHADSGAWVSVDGVPTRIRTVAPQFTALEADCEPNATVDIIGGDGPTAEQWAAWTGSIGDEVMTSIPAHVRRVYVRN